MKILSIRIKNLASLAGEHFIDFESDPLASAGLIAIVGKTGAGKSTILDAMCLALFNKIPRLKDSDGKLTDVDGSELLTNSPLTVLRRGTAHGFAELCFVAQDQKHYLARWEIKRSREKIDGKLQSVQRYLKCLTDGVVVADKTKAVDDSIKKISQLSFEQFTRAVLLAQSEVTAFLKARDNERGELLEYLTNSNIFGKIGQLAYDKTKQIANQRKELENVLGHIEILSDEDLATSTAEFTECNTQLKKLEYEKTALEKHQQWFERKQKLDGDIIHKQMHYDEQLKTQLALTAQKEQLTQLEIFSDIRPLVFQKQQLDKNLSALEPQIQSSQKAFDLSTVEFDAEKQCYISAEQALNNIQNFEQQYQTELAEVRKCVLARDAIADEYKKIKTKTIILNQNLSPLLEQQQKLDASIQRANHEKSQLQQQLQDSQQYIELDQGLHAHIQQLNHFIQHHEKIEQQLGSLSEAKNTVTTQQIQLQKMRDQYGAVEQIQTQIQTLRRSREQKIQELSQLEKFQQNIKQWSELTQLSAELTQTLRDTDKRSKQLNEIVQTTESAFQNIKIERAQLQKTLQQQRLLHSENIEKLRAELQLDEPCLVCGSTEHPYSTEDSSVSKALFELQQQQEQQAESKEQEAFNTWQVNLQALTQLKTEISQYQAHLQQQHDASIQLKTELSEKAKILGLEINFELDQVTLEHHIQSIHAQWSLDTQSFDQQCQQLEQAVKDQNTLKQQLQDSQYLLSNAEQLQQQVQHIVQCLSTRELEQWHIQATFVAKSIYAQLKKRAETLAQRDSLNKNLETDEQNLNVLKTNINHLNQQILEHEQSLKETSEKGLKNTEAANQLILTMTGLQEIKPNEWLNEHDQKRQHAQRLYTDSKQKFEQIRIQHEQQKNALEQLRVQQLQIQNSLFSLSEQIKHWLQQHPNFDLEKLIELSQISPTQEQHIRLSIQTNERLVNEALSALKTMQEQLIEHEQHKPEITFYDLKSCVEHNLEALKVQQDSRDRLKSKLDMHQSNLDKQKQFAQQIQEIQQEEHRWGKISGLMGDAHGKRFRDYAQQYNLDILIEHANQQLTLLSQRYTLKRLDNSLSLAIIDHDMDGEMRSVSSLSGGESFLTALALSLAIANMASGSMKIESLFIDEGFGTLDASSLHMVMNALDQLQSQGRKVVLISHIQEMHERIPVQIQVRALGAGASHIEVVG